MGSFRLAAGRLHLHKHFNFAESQEELDAGCVSPTSSHQRLQCGLPGYLILFDPHTFVPQRQLQLSKLPSLSEFLTISMHFTATPSIPPTSSVLKPCSINGTPLVKLEYFTTDLQGRLRTL